MSAKDGEYEIKIGEGLDIDSKVDRPWEQRSRRAISEQSEMNSEISLKTIRRRLVSLQVVVCGLAMVAMVSAEVWSGGSESSMSLLKLCPNRPNCVSSWATEGPRKMDPIPYQGSIEEARQRLLEIIRSFDRSTVVRNDGNCLRVEFRSKIFSFIDDVEFVFDDASKLINFRSASRLGYYDFRVNRRRMQTIIRQFSLK